MSFLSAASMESYGRAYPYLLQLHVLSEVEDGYKLLVHGRSSSASELQSPLTTTSSLSPSTDFGANASSSSSSSAVNANSNQNASIKARGNGNIADREIANSSHSNSIAVGMKRIASSGSNSSVDSDNTFLFRDPKRRLVAGIVFDSFIKIYVTFNDSSF